MRNLLRRLFAHNRGFLIASVLVLGSFQFILCAVVTSMNLESTFEQILTFAPPVIRSMIEQSMLGGSTQGVLAFGWNHPITHAIVTAAAITFGARAIAGEIENGAIELLLAQPLSRTAYLGAHLVFGLLSFGLIALAGILGTLIGQRVFRMTPFGTPPLLWLMLNLVLLQTAIFTVTLAISAWGREAGRVAVAGVMIAVVSFLINVVATLWPKASGFKPYSLHSYYDPRAILVRAEYSVASIVVLSAVAFGAAGLAFWRFTTRDLP